MRLELKIEEIHKENLKSINRLAFLSDGLRMIKRMITRLSASEISGNEVVKDCSELDSKISDLKKDMIRQDCHLLSFLCTGKLIPEDKLEEGKLNTSQIDQLNNRYKQLRKKLINILRSTKR